jgi:tRNA U34 2-thiouridine synthase MnmA/TrmU
MNADERGNPDTNRQDARNAKGIRMQHEGTETHGNSERIAVSGKRTKAVALLSGGLDSILACRMMMGQGIEVVAVNFTSPFCTCTSKGCRHQASKVAEELGIALKLLPTGQDYIEMVKHPKHGRGSHMNPCIDCRIFTFTRARVFADEIGADFVFSGEVLGERPMSQHLRAMMLIEEKSGLKGRILRPLSAQLLDPTEPELKGLVDRSRLKSVQGRCRQPQLAMVREYGMTDYPCPAGGCLLTDAQFSARLKDAFAHGEDTVRHMQFLKVGRHFRLPSKAKVVVGRNEPENNQLRALVQAGELVLEAEEVAGPVAVLQSLNQGNDRQLAARICARYGDARTQVRVLVDCAGEKFEVAPATDEELAVLRV